MSTLHGYNWKALEFLKDGLVKTICGMRRHPLRIAKRPIEMTCSVCTLRVIREAQVRGLSLADSDAWTWGALGAPDLDALLRGNPDVAVRG